MIKALGTFLEQVIKMSIVEGTEKMGCPPLPEVSHGEARQDSKGVVDEPPSETSEKGSQIDLKNKITLIFKTSKPAPFSALQRFYSI